jgi:hypothetical protein
MKYTYKKMASGGSVKKEKGYTAKERKGLQSLIEELADPYAGDVTGGSSVTSTKKSKKRMPGGGLVSGPGSSQRTQPSSPSGKFGGRAPGGTVSKAYSGVSGAAGAAKGAYGTAKGATRYASGGSVESSKSGAAGVPSSFSRRKATGVSPPARGGQSGGMVDLGRKIANTYNRTGVFGAPRKYASGGIVGRPARSYRDMKAGAGSGVGRLQKTKIARGR